MNDLISSFAQAFLLIGANALIVAFVANRAGYVSGRLAALWLGVGILVGRLGPGNHAFDDTGALGTALGGATVLTLLWYVWFSNRKGQLDG